MVDTRVERAVGRTASLRSWKTEQLILQSGRRPAMREDINETQLNVRALRPNARR